MSQNLRVPRPVRRLDVRVFQHATENRERVLEALRFVTGAGEYRESRAEGYHGNPIVIIETELGSRKEIEQFWARAREAGIFPGLEENLEERVNDDGELFIRFEKQKALEGKMVLSAGDDVIAARARVFELVDGQEKRADRSAAIRVMREFLKGDGEGGQQGGKAERQDGGKAEGDDGRGQQAAGSGQEDAEEGGEGAGGKAAEWARRDEKPREVEPSGKCGDADGAPER